MSRPDTVFDPMLQHERTALAWERTAIASMVTGTLLARYATELHVSLAVVGIAQVLVGSILLVWAGLHYEDLHAPLRRGENPSHRRATQALGIATVAFTGLAAVVGIAVAVT